MKNKIISQAPTTSTEFASNSTTTTTTTTTEDNYEIYENANNLILNNENPKPSKQTSLLLSLKTPTSNTASMSNSKETGLIKEVEIKKEKNPLSNLFSKTAPSKAISIPKTDTQHASNSLPKRISSNEL